MDQRGHPHHPRLEQIALQLTGHARAVACDVRRRADQLPEDSGTMALADVVLREAEGRLPVPIEGTVRCVQNGARFVRALYERLDRLEAVPAPEGVVPSGAERGLDGCFQLLRQRVECLPRLTQQAADMAQSIFLGVGGLADRSSGGGLVRLHPRIPWCSTGCQ
jgi:hypothetical protein